MVTRGVASVRSPVCNLQQFNTNARHETFAEAVVHEFRDEYSVHDEVRSPQLSLTQGASPSHVRFVT